MWQGPQSRPTPCCLWGARTLQALGRALQARGHRDGPRAFPGGLPQHRARGHRASPDSGVNAPGCVPRAPPGFPAGAEGATPPACPRRTPGWAAPGATRVPPGPPGPTGLPWRSPGPPGRGRSRLGAAAHRLPAGQRSGPPPGAGRWGAPGASPSRPCPSCRCTGTRPVPAPFPPRVPVPVPPLPACAAGSVSVPAPGPCPGPCPVPVPCPVPPPPPRVSGRRAPRSVTSRHGPAGAVTSRGGCPRPAPPDAARGPGTRGDPPGARPPRPAHAWDVPGGGTGTRRAWIRSPEPGAGRWSPPPAAPPTWGARPRAAARPAATNQPRVGCSTSGGPGNPRHGAVPTRGITPRSQGKAEKKLVGDVNLQNSSPV